MHTRERGDIIVPPTAGAHFSKTLLKMQYKKYDKTQNSVPLEIFFPKNLSFPLLDFQLCAPVLKIDYVTSFGLNFKLVKEDMQVLLCDGMHGESMMTRIILQRATQIDTVGAVHSDHIVIKFVGKMFAITER